METGPKLEAKKSVNGGMRIKQEPGDEMKDFAENTMNELLGWYGYEGVDTCDTQNLNLRRFAGNSDRSPATPSSGLSACETVSNASSENSQTEKSGGESDLASQHQTLVSALKNSKTTGKQGSSEGSSTTYITCAWCQKNGVKLFTLKSSSGTKAFCSEVCFTQCRRASFKKNKICDWCKHVRHTVNYVDFQDGEQQLQFCNEKCLSQYKMNIFCKETQEHLQQIRQQMEDSNPASEKTSNQILITPDLWMKKLEDKKRMRRENSQASAKEVKSEEDEERDEEALDLTETSSEKRCESKDVSPQSDTQDHPSLLEKLDRRYRENKVRRVRARDSVSTPLSVNSSPGSSRLSSHSPSAASNVVTPPVANGTTGMPPLGSLLGALGPGFAGHPLLYHHLLANGAPGLLPPGLLPMPDQHGRPSNLRMLPSLEGSQTSPRSSSNQPATQGSATSHPTPPPGMALPPRPPHPGLFPALPPGFPMPPGLPPGVVPPPVVPGILPPNTLMSPYPVFVPLPIPVPILVPVKTDKDFDTLLNLYNSKKAASMTKTENIKREPVRPESQPAPSTMMSDSMSVKSDTPPTSASVPLQCSISDESDPSKDRIMCACCQISNPNEMCAKIADPSCSDSQGRQSVTSENTSPMSMHSDVQDEVIDLSKDKTMSEKPPVLSNIDQNKNRMIVIKPSPPILEGDVSSPLVPPLFGGHLMPPRDHSYSSRRGLILDAPSVPRNRNKSPSPEKRILLRSPTRDMLFAKRRCLRRSIKTK